MLMPFATALELFDMLRRVMLASVHALVMERPWEPAPVAVLVPINVSGKVPILREELASKKTPRLVAVPEAMPMMLVVPLTVIEALL